MSTARHIADLLSTPPNLVGLNLVTASSGKIALVPTDTATDKTINVPAQSGTMVVTDASGNLGVGVTPVAWSGGYKAIQVGSQGALWSYPVSTGDTYLSSNYSYVGGDKYIGNGFASAYKQYNGAHSWGSAGTGTAGSALSMSYNMTLDANGNVGIGATPSAWSYSGVIEGTYGTFMAHNSVGTACIGNAYYNAGWKYRGNSAATMVVQDSAGIAWNVAGSGTSGNAITWIQAMKMDLNGNVGIGAGTSGSTRLKVSSDTTSINPMEIANTRSTAATDYSIIFTRNGAIVGSVQTSLSATSFLTSSDYRLKNITGPVKDSGSYIDLLNPVVGSWKVDGAPFVGLIAHETQAISKTQVATGEKDGEKMQAMDYSSPEIIANMIAELKSLRARVATLEKQ